MPVVFYAYARHRHLVATPLREWKEFVRGGSSHDFSFFMFLARLVDSAGKFEVALYRIFSLSFGVKRLRARHEHRDTVRSSQVLGIASPATTENTW